MYLYLIITLRNLLDSTISILFSSILTFGIVFRCLLDNFFNYLFRGPTVGTICVLVEIFFLVQELSSSQAIAADL